MTDLPDYEPLFEAAIKQFWGIRSSQAEAQLVAGKVDAGTRGAVTGGKHLDPVQAVITKVFVDAGTPADWIHVGPAAWVPGWYREKKNFDVVAAHDQTVYATVEVKSQVGAFGNNQNNRIEEAVGQLYDHLRAAEEGLVPGLRTWFGYVMIVERNETSTRPVRPRGIPVAPVDPAFLGMSYVDRYVEAFTRMIKSRLLDAAVVAITDKGTGDVDYPSVALSFQHFAKALHNRMDEALTAE